MSYLQFLSCRTFSIINTSLFKKKKNCLKCFLLNDSYRLILRHMTFSTKSKFVCECQLVLKKLQRKLQPVFYSKKISVSYITRSYGKIPSMNNDDICRTKVYNYRKYLILLWASQTFPWSEIYLKLQDRQTDINFVNSVISGQLYL